MKKFLNQKGQGFSVFRLLIASIMGLMILIIILGVADYFNSLRLNLGIQKVYDSFVVASNKHDGTIVIAKKIDLPSGTIITTLGLAAESGVEKDCIKLTGSQLLPVNYSEKENVVELKKDLSLDVYFKCVTNFGGCATYCILSLGQKID